jgi:hypothetical protein
MYRPLNAADEVERLPNQSKSENIVNDPILFGFSSGLASECSKHCFGQIVQPGSLSLPATKTRSFPQKRQDFPRFA